MELNSKQTNPLQRHQRWETVAHHPQYCALYGLRVQTQPDKFPSRDSPSLTPARHFWRDLPDRLRHPSRPELTAPAKYSLNNYYTFVRIKLCGLNYRAFQVSLMKQRTLATAAGFERSGRQTRPAWPTAMCRQCPSCCMAKRSKCGAIRRIRARPGRSRSARRKLWTAPRLLVQATRM